MKLSANFMAELFKLIYLDPTLTQIACTNLTYQLIPKEWPGYKYLLREAIETFTDKETVPSLGAVSQNILIMILFKKQFMKFKVLQKLIKK